MNFARPKYSIYANLGVGVFIAFSLSSCGSGSQQQSGHESAAPLNKSSSSSAGDRSGNFYTDLHTGNGELAERNIALSGLPHHLNVAVEQPQERTIDGALRLKGRVEPEFGKETDVSAHVNGRITELRVKPGQMVSQGDVLALIDSREISELQAEVLEAKSKVEIAQAHVEREEQIYRDQLKRPQGLMEAKAKYKKLSVAKELAESEFKRQEGLYHEKIVSAKDYATAKAQLSDANVEMELATAEMQRQQQAYSNQALMKKDLQLAQAEKTREQKHFNTLLQRLNFLGMDKSMQKDLLDTGKIDGVIKLVAPVSGVASHLDLATGEVVDPEKSLMKITDLSSVLVEFSVPEVNAPTITLGTKVEIQFPSYPGKTFDSAVSYVGEHVHATSQTVSFRAKLVNSQRLFKANMAAEVAVVESPRTALSVPVASVQELDDHKIVFVDSPGGYKMREVRVGVQDPKYIEICSGLAPDEKVVTSGSRDLKAALSYHHSK